MQPEALYYRVDEKVEGPITPENLIARIERAELPPDVPIAVAAEGPFVPANQALKPDPHHEAKSTRLRQAYLLAVILIAANILWFLRMILAQGFSAVVEPNTETLLKVGADFGPSTILEGEYWRMLSSAFVHIGIFHLGFNVYALWVLAPWVTYIYGRSRFLALYPLAAMGSAVFSIAWRPVGLSAGASGAIFGLLGAMGAYYLRQRQHVDRKLFKEQMRSLLTVLGINVAIGLSVPAIDNAGHLGGLVTGFLLGLAMAPAKPIEKVQDEDAQPARGHAGMIAAVVVTLATCAAGVWQLHPRVANAPALQAYHLANDYNAYIQTLKPIYEESEAARQELNAFLAKGTLDENDRARLEVLRGQVEQWESHAAAFEPSTEDVRQLHQKALAFFQAAAKALLVRMDYLLTPEAGANAQPLQAIDKDMEVRSQELEQAHEALLKRREKSE